MKQMLLKRLHAILVFVGMVVLQPAWTQTDLDAIMMNKTQFCQGFTYEHSSWDNYWEGTFKRSNQNLGTVSTNMLMYMPNYGITDKLNVMAMGSYVWTKASKGTLHSRNGFQDVAVWLKWKPLSFTFGKNRLSLITLGGVSTPVTDYVIDYLPLSIGLGSTNLSARGMVDYRRGRFTVTGSGTYTWRSNVNIDRPAYFDTEQHNTTEVKMPNSALYQLRTGYRGRYLIAEALLTRMVTLGGFDITQNNMPFPSNRMKATTVGAAIKYTLKPINELAIVGGGSYTISGRNMGQSTSFHAGVFYAFYFRPRPKS